MIEMVDQMIEDQTLDPSSDLLKTLACVKQIEEDKEAERPYSVQQLTSDIDSLVSLASVKDLPLVN